MAKERTGAREGDKIVPTTSKRLLRRLDSVELTYPCLTEFRKGSFAGSSNDLSGPSSTEKPFDQNFN